MRTLRLLHEHKQAHSFRPSRKAREIFTLARLRRLAKFLAKVCHTFAHYATSPFWTGFSRTQPVGSKIICSQPTMRPFQMIITPHQSSKHLFLYFIQPAAVSPAAYYGYYSGLSIKAWCGVNFRYQIFFVSKTRKFGRKLNFCPLQRGNSLFNRRMRRKKLYDPGSLAIFPSGVRSKRIFKK